MYSFKQKLGIRICSSSQNPTATLNIAVIAMDITYTGISMQEIE
jgi:hypothetical protein